MAEASVLHIQAPRERTSLRRRVRSAARRVGAALLPRRWMILREMSLNARYYSEAKAQAKASNASSFDLEVLRSEEAHCYWELEEELAMLESSRLLKQAQKFMLPTPDFCQGDTDDPDSDPNWRLGTRFKPKWYLKPQAMQDLRTRIRAERKARREPVAEWIKIIGGFGGVVFLIEKLARLILH